MDLVERCNFIEELFIDLERTSGKLAKEDLVKNFTCRFSSCPGLLEDLDYCFEVLAGRHKVGFTYIDYDTNIYRGTYDNYSIKGFIEYFLKTLSNTYDDIFLACVYTPVEARDFIRQLVNREWRLGYSNKNNMITNISPMLAKRYPDSFHEQYYYVQEKLDGNRCIARFNNDELKWEFFARSGKPLKVNFDMDWAPIDLIFDGEVMTLGHAGSRDFNKTSGAINGKFTDKTQLHYYIYDIIEPKLSYEDRRRILYEYIDEDIGKDCTILKTLDKLWLYPNVEYNWQLDELLDFIVNQGGEGLILRDPDAGYQSGKRTDALLKYKKTQTMDLRIVGWNEGKGKYEGMIGSFICEDDNHTIRVNVAGMSDEIRGADNPEAFIGKIIEVAYFDISQSKGGDKKSLRFPRLKKFRPDKETTSIY